MSELMGQIGFREVLNEDDGTDTMNRADDTAL